LPASGQTAINQCQLSVYFPQPEQLGLLLPAASLLLCVLGDEVAGRGSEIVRGSER
jgi:hypothetical protein